MMNINIQSLRELVLPVKRRLRSVTGKHFWLRYTSLAAYRTVCGALIGLGGRTLCGRRLLSVTEVVADVEWVFNQYKTASGLQQFHGRMAEVGPGDSCALSLMFLAHGCESVDLADRFHFVEPEHQRQVNRAIVEKYPQLGKQMVGSEFSWRSFTGLRRYNGENASAEKFFAQHRGYDYIVSAAALEHIYDPGTAVKAMASALNPGGLMIHGIDFRDHGQFSEWFHDLKFLELPEILYAPLKWKGGPNRFRLGFYTKALEDLGLRVRPFASFVTGTKQDIPVSHVDKLPVELRDSALASVMPVRHRLAKPFRDLPDTDLIVAGAVVVGAK